MDRRANRKGKRERFFHLYVTQTSYFLIYALINNIRVDMRTCEVGKALKSPHMWRLKRYAVKGLWKMCNFCKGTSTYFAEYRTTWRLREHFYVYFSFTTVINGPSDVFCEERLWACLKLFMTKRFGQDLQTRRLCETVSFCPTDLK